MTRQELPGTDAARYGSIDLSLMILMHDALRRDLVRLAKVASRRNLVDPSRRPAINAGWELFKEQLHIHHSGEDEQLWPKARKRMARSDAGLSLLAEMEAEHDLVDPLLDEVDLAFADRETGDERLSDVVDALTVALLNHLNHEERDALPLLGRVLTAKDWKEVIGEQRKMGLKVASRFFPWMLDEQTPAKTAKAVGMMPPPLRVVYRRSWQPKYARQERW
jgi:hemerythrin-like domain-containing protein